MKPKTYLEYMKQARRMNDEQLRYIIAYCYYALHLSSENPMNGYYLQEIECCTNELSRRASTKI